MLNGLSPSKANLWNLISNICKKIYLFIGKNITDEDIPSILITLYYFPINILCIAHNKIKNKGAIFIGKELKSNTFLQTINLYGR